MGRGPRKWLRLQARRHRRIVEVGVWKGRTTQLLARNTIGTVWAVDHWQGTPHDPAQHVLYPDAGAAYGAFRKHLRSEIERGKVRVVNMPSVQAAAHLANGKPFDFVFLDADHSYDAVRADIVAWLPLLAADGLLAGHDYGKPTFPGVTQAVDEVLGGAVKVGPASIWSVRVPVAREVAA